MRIVSFITMEIYFRLTEAILYFLEPSGTLSVWLYVYNGVTTKRDDRQSWNLEWRNEWVPCENANSMQYGV